MSSEMRTASAIMAPSLWGDYWALLKPRVMSLVIFTSAVGIYLAPGTIHPVKAMMALLFIALAAGASGCLNMYLERKTDAKMERTRGRPLPQKRISPESAATFGMLLGTTAVLCMGLGVNWVAAGWLFLSIGFYLGIYTLWLKPWTDQNIVIGGAAGALPPVIGWAAVSPEFSLEPWLLFIIIFLWTPPHFWVITLWCAEDYKKAGIPMLINTKGPRETKRQIALYTALLWIASYLPPLVSLGGIVYVIVATLLGACFFGLALLVYMRPEKRFQMALFSFSLVYLFVLYLSLVVDVMCTT